MKSFEILIITGMSGAGKSSAIRFFEDRGYLTIDNLPVKLLSNMYKLFFKSSKIRKVACVIDSRSWNSAKEFINECKKLKKLEINFKILFLDSANEVILNRYNLTRRKHPIKEFNTLLENIKEERKQLEEIKDLANEIINTSNITPKELNKELEKLLTSETKKITISISSFGFKYGIPIDLDLMFDVRFLPNPYYVEDLKNKTGNNREVFDYVFNFDLTNEFYLKLKEMLIFLIPQYINEGKSHLSIGIGCSGGKHRSVSIVNKLYDELKENDTIEVLKSHRDIRKN
ncbi:UPF0042 nucleotide-binding protein [Hypnocyclicus thermotrophus]|uniref:UPF0042 nucleotide-binding protein n=1 Tax=Hypnocyclicus thermotrophus TaxID=1627895 RepID=A0AA46DXQ3_9FUSO|nr:RNase adapter RapZ [Hypnocyclicus thermotrophus]TDT68584.1 UPF0042 nucleotide-binding protein [Hypnocyclicus thermotrophus]